MLRILCTSALLALFTSVAQADAPRPLPPAPQYYVLDEPAVLSEKQRKALETLLIEHAQATDEHLLIAIFKGLSGADLAQRTHSIFEAWFANRGLHRGALLAIYAQEQRAWIEAGYGLPALDEATDHLLLRDHLLPELNAGHPFTAVGMTALEILRAVGSPLIESGRGLQLLQEGGIGPTLRATQSHAGPASWLAFVWVGLIVSGGVLYNLLAAEAHFTGEGWYRPNPWKLLSPGSLRRATGPMTPGTGGTDGSW